MTQTNRDDVHYQIDALNEQAWQQYQQQPETAWDICQQALTLSSSSPSPYLRGQIESLRTQSYLFVNQGNFTDALTVARQGMALYEAANPDSLTTETTLAYVRLFACQGNAQRMLGQVAEASAAFYNGLQLAETLGAVFEQGMMCDGLGTLYQDMGDYEQSRAYMEKGAQFFQQIGDTYWLTVTYQGLGSIHEDLGLYEESLAYGQKALALSRSERYPKLEAMALYGVGLAHFRLQNYEMALIFLAESETLARELERLDITAVANLTIGQLHLAQGADGLALEPLQTAVSLAQTVQFLRPQIEAHRDLSLAHRRLSNWQQALTHFEAFHQLAAQMLDQEKVHQLTEMRTRYDAERHQRENELYRLKNVVLAQKNEELQALYQEKDEVLAIVAHDLKSPLNAILLSSELLSYRLANSEQEELRGSAQNITRAALIMTEIIQHLLTSNRIETGQIEVKRRPCSLADLIKQLLDMEGAQAQKKQITLTTTLPDDDTITTDVQLLAEALTNLVSNAIKYSPPQTEVQISAHRSAKAVFIAVQDQGYGILPEEKPLLFQKYTRLSSRPMNRKESSGLGLYIAHKLVEKLNGRIHVESAGHNKGSCFTVELPL